jgi:predicted nuclease of restriction endonuclease-like (RecB) superfamily
MEIKNDNTDYTNLVALIASRYEKGRASIAAYVNTEIVNTYWQIGQYIVEFEQGGSSKAIYGKSLLENLSKDLSLAYGKGFSRSNLNNMRLFYKRFPICEELPHKLSWTHFVELLKIDDPLERSFYTQQTLLDKWSTTELIRQKKTSLILRLAASKDKDGIMQLAKQGQIVEKPADLIREPFVLEFLKIPEPYHLSETELEARLIDNLQHFLLELGKGFAFIGRQYRITLGNRHHYIDSVF